MMKFDLSDEQVEKFEKWRKKKTKALLKGNFKKPDFEFCFSTCGIGVTVIVKCADGTELNLTEYDKW